jgi:hypothetical protein
MKGLELKLHIMLYATVMILIIIALFYSFSKTEVVGNLKDKRTVGSEFSMKIPSYLEQRSKSETQSKSTGIEVLHFEFEKEEIDFDKVYTGNLFAIGLRWCYSILILLTMPSFLRQYVRGWILNVALFEFQLLSVLFIELKDGKKDTLVLHYSI